MKWYPIKSAPWETLVLTRGPSGFDTNFRMKASRTPNHNGGNWTDINDIPLIDYGYRPTEWQPIPE